MSIRIRLIGGIVLLLLVVLLFAVFASIQVGRLASVSEQITDRSMRRIEFMSRINTNLVQWRGLGLTLLLSDNPQIREEYLRQLNELAVDTEKLVYQYSGVIEDPVRRADYEAFLEHIADYLIVHRRLETLVREREEGEAEALFASSQGPFDEMLFHIGRIRSDETAAARQASQAATSMVDRTRYLFLLSTVLVIVIQVGLGLYVWRSLSTGLQRLLAATRQVARGDLSQPVTPVGKDEFATLATAFNAMIHSLKQSQEENQRLTQEALNLQEERITLLRNQFSRAVIAQEEERKRIARDLHDDTVQVLVSLSRRFDHLLSHHKRFPREVQDQLREMWELTDQTLEGVRRFSQNLRPSIIDDLGLLPAIDWLVRRLGAEQPIQTQVEVTGEPCRPLPQVELSLFRIVQEALRNIAKHARASQATIRVNFSDEKISIAVSDDGQGFTLPASLGEAAVKGQLGLLGMQERAQLLGGRLEIRSQPGQGTTVFVEAPCCGEALLGSQEAQTGQPVSPWGKMGGNFNQEVTR